LGHFYRAQQNLSLLHKIGWRSAEKIRPFFQHGVLDLEFYDSNPFFVKITCTMEKVSLCGATFVIKQKTAQVNNGTIGKHSPNLVPGTHFSVFRVFPQSLPSSSCDYFWPEKEMAAAIPILY
jgi:hypothetical protein